jgi:hypothetical protein
MRFGAWRDTLPPEPWGRCTSDACSCGRKPCPTPDACRLADGDRPMQMLAPLLIYAALVVAVVGVIFGPWA